MTQEEKKGMIFCLTFNNFPDKDAGSIRLFALAKGMVELGYEVRVISMGKNHVNGWHQIDEGIFHVSFRNTLHGKRSLLKSYLNFNSLVNRELDAADNVRAVFLFNTMSFVFDNRRLMNLGVPLIYDSTEWYNACEFKQGVLSPEYISNSLVVKRKVRKPWKVIAISRLLEAHYVKKGIQVKRIPAVMDVGAFPHVEYTPGEKIKVVYAGSPGRKDALYLIIEGVALLPKELRDRFDFKIIGATREQFAEHNGVRNIPENIHFMGRLPRECVLDELSNSDFTTFLRDEKLRFVNAGFPSKLAESMSMGVPVITNITSDLSEYLSDGENAIIVEQFTSEAYSRALAKVVEIAHDKFVEMHRKAKETALESFDYSNYLSDLEFLISREV